MISVLVNDLYVVMNISTVYYYLGPTLGILKEKMRFSIVHCSGLRTYPEKISTFI